MFSYLPPTRTCSPVEPVWDKVDQGSIKQFESGTAILCDDNRHIHSCIFTSSSNSCHGHTCPIGCYTPVHHTGLSSHPLRSRPMEPACLTHLPLSCPHYPLGHTHLWSLNGHTRHTGLMLRHICRGTPMYKPITGVAEWVQLLLVMS